MHWAPPGKQTGAWPPSHCASGTKDWYQALVTGPESTEKKPTRQGGLFSARLAPIFAVFTVCATPKEGKGRSKAIDKGGIRTAFPEVRAALQRGNPKRPWAA